MDDLTQDIDTPTTIGTYPTPIMVPDIRGITADHSPAPIHTTREAATLEGTMHALLPATAAAHIALQPMDKPITPCAMIPTGIVTPHPTLTISPAGATLTTPWTRASLTPGAPAMQYKILSPKR